MDKNYPQFYKRDLGSGTWELTIKGKTYQVDIQDLGGKSYRFSVDGGPMQTSYGHPVNDDQAPDVPPAAVIAVIKGRKSVNLPWSTYWDDPMY